MSRFFSFSASSRSADRPVDQSLFVAFLCLLVWAPLPLGSNREWAWSLLQSGVFALSAWWLLAYVRGQFQLPEYMAAIKWPVVMLLMVCGWLLVQIIPLPLALVQALSPVGASLHLAADSEASWIPLSVDPYATWQTLLKSLAYMLIFLLTIILVTSQKRARMLGYTIVFSGLFQASYGSFMVLSGLEYGFFIAKDSYLGVATGTFVNRNHLAGFLELSLAVGIGLMVGSLAQHNAKGWRQHVRQLLTTLLSGKARLRIYLAIMVVALVLTHSRMGNTAFFSSLMIAGFLSLLISRMRNKRKGKKDAARLKPLLILLVSLIVIDVFIVGAWFGFDKVVERVEKTSHTSEQRDEVVMYGNKLFADFWLTGSGGGSFYSTFPAYQGSDIRVMYDHAHNDYLQFASEFGVLATLALAVFVILCLYAAVLAMWSRRSPFFRGMGFACLMGGTALLVHSFVDFNLQIPANAVYFMVVLALGYVGLLAEQGGKKG